MSYLLRPTHPHRCALPPSPGNRPADPIGTIWRCDVPICLQHWRVQDPEGYGPTWEPIKERRARRLIRRHKPADPSPGLHGSEW